ncbi:hypothetical protein AMEX_G8377 [Astyanax mexicanus]|uniref:Uncharacterized protein n=1 Tax=Astyanax mexicanus TaxID=7994 RepID=A0A8T2LZA9_ASTMX|nr:hypothetical protein AMEX_G8377 [Astyanax mexicanus]
MEEFGEAVRGYKIAIQQNEPPEQRVLPLHRCVQLSQDQDQDLPGRRSAPPVAEMGFHSRTHAFSSSALLTAHHLLGSIKALSASSHTVELEAAGISNPKNLRMKNAVHAVFMLWVVSFPVGVLGKPLFRNIWTLENAENRDLFLSALQSYFSDRGMHVDRTAPEFPVLAPKDMQVRAAQRKRRNSDHLELSVANPTYPTV